MASRKKPIKRTNIPLNVVSASKCYKITHIKAPVKTFDACTQQLGEIYNDTTDQQMGNIYQTDDSTYDEVNVQQQTCKRSERRGQLKNGHTFRMRYWVWLFFHG